ncbi:MAG: TonB-dependent receptor domain-containing protein, partial [Bryobacteraceae bacterium]
FFVRVSKAWEKDIAPRYFGNGADSNYDDLNPRDQVVIGNTFVPNPTWVLNVLLSAGRWREEQDSTSKGMDGTAVGFPASLVSGFGAQTIPAFAPSGYGQISNPRFLSFARPVNSIQINASKELGAHSIKFGFVLEADQLNDTDVDSPTFNFNRGLTSGPTAATNSANSGNSIASLMLGAGSGGSSPFNAAVAVQQKYYGFYGQDTWRIGKRLTLNYGLRYELQLPRTERYNRVNWFDFNVPSPVAQQAGLPLVGGLQFATSGQRGQWDTSTKDFAPRIGLSYKVTDKMVFRAGYGIFYLQTAGTGAVTNDGYSLSTPWVSTVGGDGIHPSALLGNPFPQGLLPPIGNSAGLLTDLGLGVSAYQRSHPSGYSQNFSADFQIQVGRGSVVQLGYSGSLGRKLLWGFGQNANQLPDTLLSMGG